MVANIKGLITDMYVLGLVFCLSVRPGAWGTVCCPACQCTEVPIK